MCNLGLNGTPVLCARNGKAYMCLQHVFLIPLTTLHLVAAMLGLLLQPARYQHGAGLERPLHKNCSLVCRCCCCYMSALAAVNHLSWTTPGKSHSQVGLRATTSCSNPHPQTPISHACQTLWGRPLLLLLLLLVLLLAGGAVTILNRTSPGTSRSPIGHLGQT